MRLIGDWLKKKERMYRNILLVLLGTLLVLYVADAYLSNKILTPLSAAADAKRPANLQVTLITNDCSNCFNMANVVSFLETQNAKVTWQANLTSTDVQAQRLISENKIESLPVLIVTGDVSKASMSSVWSQLGTKVNNNVSIVSGLPPFYSLATKKVLGLVQLVELNDNSCTTCYNVTLHERILPGYGVYVDKTTIYDISSSNGQALIQKYNITEVPTILLSPDTALYPSLNAIWGQVGTIAGDGWYVFRAVSQMGTYKDLTNNTIVNATR